MNDLDLLFRGRIKVMSTITLHSTLNISETVRDIGLEHPTRLKRNISKTAGDLRSKGPPTGNGRCDYQI